MEAQQLLICEYILNYPTSDTAYEFHVVPYMCVHVNVFIICQYSILGRIVTISVHINVYARLTIFYVLLVYVEHVHTSIARNVALPEQSNEY